MATLTYSQIRVSPGSTIHYITNKDKMISFKVHDVTNVLSYMGEEESCERVYSFSRLCSSNPDLAAKQMELYRARYCEGRNCAPKERELLGLHFFLSYTEEDDPSEAVMNHITQKLCNHPLFRGHAILGANHFDKHCKHTHFYVCNYSAEGAPKKLCMRYEDFADLRKYANRLCVEQGLSIIDLPALRHNDPDYSAWIDGIIAGGRITVHPEREEHRGTTHRKATTKQIYFKQMKEKEESALEEEKSLTQAQLRMKKARENYCWNFENDPEKPGYLRTSPNGRGKQYHVVRLYDENGRKRTLLELTCMLIIAIYRYEKAKNAPTAVQQRSGCMVRDHRLENMINSTRTALELNIRSAEDVAAAIADTGKQMNALKQEKSRHENSICRHEEILAAWDAYRNTDPDEDPEAFRQAYALLAQNRILTEETAEELRQRYRFELQKIIDYDKRLPELNRRYRNLKYLQQMTAAPDWTVEQIKREFSPKEPQSLDEQIKAAQMQKSAPKDVRTPEQHRK